MNRVAKDILMHYGVSAMDGAPGRGSGRYPLGSGEDPNQRRGDFVSRVQELRRAGMSEKDIVKAVGLESTTQLRTQYSLAVNERKAEKIARAGAMLEEGRSKAEVARELNIPESTLRSLMNERTAARTRTAQETADFLREQIKEKGMIDVGTGVERELGVPKERLAQALEILREEGYPVYGGGVPQVTNPGKQTNIKVICPPGTEHKDIYDFENVHTITDYKMRVDEDGTERFEKGFEYPASLDSSRLQIRYRDDVTPDGHTAIEKDGTIELRRGVADLDLGESHYAQVRILVDGDKYLHGQRLQAILEDDPDYYYQGRFSVNAWKSDQQWSLITIDYDVEPFKYELDSAHENWLWDTFNFEKDVIRYYKNLPVSGSLAVTVIGTMVSVTPTIIASATGMSVAYGGETYTLSKGANTIREIIIQAGENEFVFSGEGTITIEMLGGVL